MRVIKSLMLAASMTLVACGGGDDTTSSKQTTSATPATKRDCVLKYGWEPRQPYQFQLNGQMQGIDISVFKQAADKAGCDIQYIQKSWSELLTGVEKGEIDVLGGATATDERKVYADFSESYRSESFSLFISADDTYNGDSLSGFLSRANKVGVTSDYFYGKEVYDLMNHPQYGQLFVDEKSGEQSFFNILYGRIDGVLSDPVEGRYIIKRKDLGNKIRESKVNIPSESVSFMFSKKSVTGERLNTLKANIKEMADSGKVAEIINSF
ncbi:MAG: transporter substrate-binding domain-containing protein [Kangiellaceae bacterium]|nr:transporter substrate-binding domain-containing protein [Kangiellaceae bacterium]